MKSLPAPAALIAGGGALPGEVARRMTEAGIDVTVYSFTPGAVFPGLPRERVAPLLSLPGADGRLSLRALASDLAARGIRSVGMAGLIPKTVMYGGALDEALKDLLGDGRNDDHALLGRVTGALESLGLKVFHYSEFLGDSLAAEGFIAGRTFTGREAADIGYGKKILAATLPLSFGQAVVVAGGAVAAVEAMEGTDKMIRRAGELLKGSGGAVVKMMRPDQDSRYDIPAAGPGTLREMARAGLTALALEAGRVIILERDEFSSLAARFSIAVEGIAP